MTDPDKTIWARLPLLDLTDIGASTFPGRGTTYYLTLGGHDVQVYLTSTTRSTAH